MHDMPPVIKMLINLMNYDSIAFELGPKLNALGLFEDFKILNVYLGIL